MKVKLNSWERERFDKLSGIFKANERMVELYAAYLNNESTLVDKETVDMLCRECGVSSEEAFCAVLCAAFGLDSEISDSDRVLENLYMRPGIRMLEPSEFTDDPYYKNVKLPCVKHGDWELKYESFKPYEGLVYDDLEIKGFYEIPRIGFFEEEFVFPAVLEGGREWMMITPNEINTMKEPLEKMRGRVVTFGLGMGYFAYMASLKDEVESVTVVEKDPQVIELFEKNILPLFEKREKIKVICADAFEYAESVMPSEGFDTAFVDIWHDASDGLELYVKMKKHERSCPATEFHYWVERTLLSTLRRMVFEQLEPCGSEEDDPRCVEGFESMCAMLSDTYLARLAADMKKI